MSIHWNDYCIPKATSLKEADSPTPSRSQLSIDFQLRVEFHAYLFCLCWDFVQLDLGKSLWILLKLLHFYVELGSKPLSFKIFMPSHFYKGWMVIWMSCLELNIPQFLILLSLTGCEYFVLITIHCRRKLLWSGLGDTLSYGYPGNS